MKQPEPIRPPQLPLKFMRLFLKREYVEEIEGDMEELFLERTESMSVKKAAWLYTIEVIKLLRPGLIRKMSSFEPQVHPAIFKNYFKVSFRSLTKHPLNSFINIFGLSVAIGFAVFGYAFTRWTYSTDQFHVHKNEVYLVTFFSNRDGTEQQFGRSPRPMGAFIKQDFTQVSRTCRVEDRPAVVKYGDHVFHEKIRFTDPEFLEMMTFPLKWGSPESLGDLNSVVLSEEMATKYFGHDNPIGRSMVVHFDEQKHKAFTVTGVAAAFPKARTISFNFLINFGNLPTVDLAYDFQDWQAMVNATFVQIDRASDVPTIEQGLQEYRTLQHAVSHRDWAISSFHLEPLATLHERSEYIRDDISRSSRDNQVSVIYLSIVGLLMLTLACFNYINIAISTAAKRMREIGVRKSMGATRQMIAIQFLSENIVITFFAVVLGVALGQAFFIPGFEYLWSFSMDFRFDDPALWIFLPAILLLTSIASGIYPALYISHFQVVSILGGSVRFGRKNPITKVFLGIQLVLAFNFIACAFMFSMNADYVAKRSWGYDQHDVLYARVPNQGAFERLQSVMAHNPNVLSTTGSAHHVGKSFSTAVLSTPVQTIEVDQSSVGGRYLEMLGLQLTAGRWFHHDEGSDRNSIIVNELLAKNMKLQNPVGQSVRIADQHYEVIGVVKDFHSYSFFKPIRPVVFTKAQAVDFRFLTLKTRQGEQTRVFRELQDAWSHLFPEIPFEGGYQDNIWGFYFQEVEIHGIVWRVIAFLAIAMAGLGLAGLMTLNVAARTREFSIRKVLGADLRNITATIVRPYAMLMSSSLIVGAPMSYALVSFIFDSAYTYHMPVDASGALVASLILFLTFSLAAGSQISKVMSTNPVHGLKTE